MPDDVAGQSFTVVFLVALGIIAAGFVFTVYAIVRRSRTARQIGLDPFAADLQAVAKLTQSELLAPPGPDETIESRLAELDALRDKGTITEEEYAAARAKALGL